VTFIAGWSSKDATSRQSLLQLGNACVGDLGAAEVEHRKLGQPREVYQSGVGDLGALEAERVNQRSKPLQPAK